MRTAERIFGLGGAKAYAEAMDKVHAFAKATDCPLGHNVIDWLNAQTVELDKEKRAERNRLTGNP